MTTPTQAELLERTRQALIEALKREADLEQRLAAAKREIERLRAKGKK
jgi:uncharacterized small protein (DUF1192 family)